jgi:hypothetical protein
MEIRLDAKLVEYLNEEGIKTITLKKTSPGHC